ncbi:MAG: hypothetical protein ACLFNM_03195 [Candidatus Woesearchaeota archaeon]
MTLTLPESMEELVYFTRRKLNGDNEGKIICWVSKELCPKCKKALMAKPKDPKTGKPKIRSKEYLCPKCEYTEEKEEYESKLFAKAIYTCPHCAKKGEATAPFKRRTIKGVTTLRLECEHCGGNLDITKKMKEPKKKKK